LIVTQGTPREIKSSIGGKLIRCVTSLTPAEVQLLADVVNVRESRGVMEIRAINPDDAIRQLLQRDPGLSGIEVTSTSLDDAFLALTRPQPSSKFAQEVYQ
jgi:ABC-2 type transport system ATP-binding protein